MKPKGFRPGVKFRSRYGKYRLVLHTDAIVMTSDGKSILVSGGAKEGVPGTIQFDAYEFTPKNKKIYDAIAQAWEDNYGRYDEKDLTIQGTVVDIPRGLSAQDASLYMEGVQARQAEGKMLPHPGVDFWEVDPELSGLVTPNVKKLDVVREARSTINQAT